MTELSVRPLSPALGAEVALKLSSDLDEAVLQQIEHLYCAHHLLLFRDQSLSETDQLRSARRFGPISHRNPAQGKRDSILVSNVEPGGVLDQGEIFFHSDNTFFAEPLKAKLEGLRTYQAFDYEDDDNRRPSLKAVLADAPHATHPLIWTDPDSGGKALSLSEHTTARILGRPSPRRRV